MRREGITTSRTVGESGRRRLADLHVPVDWERAGRNIERKAARETAPSADFTVIGAAAARVSAEFSLSPVVDDEGGVKALIAVVRDITDRRHPQTQLSHAKKMGAIGRLAGGIAHDVNNLMTAVIGYSDLPVTDVILPHMGGWSYSRAWAGRPGAWG